MNNLKMHIALLLGLVFLSSGGLLATSAVPGFRFPRDFSDHLYLNGPIQCPACSNDSWYTVGDLKKMIELAKDKEDEDASARAKEVLDAGGVPIPRIFSDDNNDSLANSDPTITEYGKNEVSFKFLFDKAEIVKSPHFDEEGVDDDRYDLYYGYRGDHDLAGQYYIIDYEPLSPSDDALHLAKDKWIEVYQKDWFHVPLGFYVIKVRARLGDSYSEESLPYKIIVSGEAEA